MKKFFMSVILILSVFSVHAAERDYDIYLYRNKETFSVLHSMFGVIARNGVPVYKNQTHEFGEEPIFYLDKNTVVNFYGVSRDSFQYKSGEYFHRWKIYTHDDYREGWISGHDVILVSPSHTFVPLYTTGSGYFYVNGGAEYDGSFQPPFTAFITGSPYGYSGYYNGKLYLEMHSGSTPFYMEYENPNYKDRLDVIKWDEESGCYIEEYIDKSRDPSDYRYIIQTAPYSENESILKSNERYRSEEYYALLRAIKENDMSLLKKVIESGYRAEIMHEEDSPLLYAVITGNLKALDFMLENGFEPYVFVPGEYDMNQVHIEKYVQEKKFSEMPYVDTGWFNLPEGDYYVNKIILHSVKYENFSPLEYKNLAVRVRGDRVWVYDRTTMKGIENTSDARWCDCSWEECGSHFSKNLYDKIASWNVSWGEVKDGRTDYYSNELRNFYTTSGWGHNLTPDWVVHYCLYHCESEEFVKADGPNNLYLAAASLKEGVQNEYEYVFGSEPVDEPEIVYEINFPLMLIPTESFRAYSKKDFSKSPNLTIPANDYDFVYDYDDGKFIKKPDAIYLNGSVESKNGIYYEAEYKGKKFWIYENDIPQKSLFQNEYFLLKRMGYMERVEMDSWDAFRNQ